MSKDIRFRQYTMGLHTTFYTDKITDSENIEKFDNEGFSDVRIKDLSRINKILYKCMNCCNEYTSINGIKLPCFDEDNICSLPMHEAYKQYYKKCSEI